MRRDELAEQLKRLQTAELIRVAQRDPELEFWFKHAVTHEAVYGSLLKSTRAGLHRRVAETIERTTPEELGDRAATLALHYERAGLYDRAFKHAVAAGDRALRVYALGEAVEFYNRALAMVERLSERAPAAIQAVYASRGRAIQARGDNKAALANFQAMLAAAAATGDPSLQADALNFQTTLKILASQPFVAIDSSMDEALRLARAAGDPLLIGRALWNLGLAYRLTNPQRSIEYFIQAHTLVKDDASTDKRMRELEGYVLYDLSMTESEIAIGQLRQAEGHLRQAMAIFRELDHRPMLADTLGSVATLELFSGNPAAARAAVAEGLSISEAIGNEWTTTYLLIGRADLETDAGNLETALEFALRGVPGANASGFAPFIGISNRQLAYLYFELGQVVRAQKIVRVAARVMREHMKVPFWRALSIGLMAQSALARGDSAEAWKLLSPLAEESDEIRGSVEGLFYSAAPFVKAGLALGRLDDVRRFCDWFIPRLEESDLKRILGEMYYWRGQLHATLDESAAAEADYTRARDLLLPAEARILLWRIDAALAELYEATGSKRKAAEARKRAVALISWIADGITKPELRRSFLGRPEVMAALADRPLEWDARRRTALRVR